MEDLEELDAMRKIASALSELNQETRKRVLHWAIDKFDIESSKISYSEKIENETQEKDDVTNESADQFETVADLYFHTSPSTDAEKALVVGYWFQFMESKSNFDALTVNTELKHLGHQIGNITRAFNQLKNKKPQLAYQTRKEGSTKQARKKYKLTTAGQNYVERMIDDGGTARSH